MLTVGNRQVVNDTVLDSSKFINLQSSLWRIRCHASEHLLVLKGTGKNLSLFITITGTTIGHKGAALFLGVCFTFN